MKKYRTEIIKDWFNSKYYAEIDEDYHNYTIYKNNQAILYQPSKYSNLFNKNSLKEEAIAHIKYIIKI